MHYGPLRTWLSFYATINPRFPQMEKGVRRAAADERIAAVRLLPSLHHYALDAPEVDDAMAAARAEGVPVNLTARIVDDRVAPQYVQQGARSKTSSGVSNAPFGRKNCSIYVLL